MFFNNNNKIYTAIATLVPDFANLLTIIMQLGFWITPIVWDLSMISNYPKILSCVKCITFTYLVTGFRGCFMGGNIVTRYNGVFTIIFWVTTIIMFAWEIIFLRKVKKIFQTFYKRILGRRLML